MTFVVAQPLKKIVSAKANVVFFMGHREIKGSAVARVWLPEHWVWGSLTTKVTGAGALQGGGYKQGP